MRERSHAFEWMLLIVLALIWGSSFVFYKILDDAGVPPFTIALGRVAIASAAMLLVLAVRRERLPRDARTWRTFIIMGALNSAFPFVLIAWGETRIHSGLAAILNATTPMFALIVARVAGTERLTPLKAAGMLAGLAGVAVAVGADALRGLDVRSAGQLASLSAAAIYGCGAVYGRRFAHLGLSPFIGATGQLCGSTLILAPFALLLDHPWTLHAPLAASWPALLGIGLLCTSFAYVIYFRLIATLGGVNASLVTMLVPLSALAIGAAALHERVGWNALAGLALIAAGLVAIDGRLLRRRGGVVLRLSKGDDAAA